MTHRTGRVLEQGRRGRAADARVRLLGIPVETFCATEAYAEKALRELALQVLPPPGSRNGRPGAEQALGEGGFTELNEHFFDLAEHAADFMPVRDKVAPHVQHARADGATHVDVDVRLPSVCGRTSAQFNELLDAVERLSAADVLRTPTPAAQVTQFRRWYLAQIHAQLEVAARPQPFPESSEGSIPKRTAGRLGKD
jgi:hypothetical protein